jgi:hypothetical protein
MMRLAWIAGFIAGVNGLQINDEPLALHGSRVTTGSVAALDPDLTNCLGETFHVTQAGTYVMIGLPSTCDPESPDDCELIVFATFDKLENDSECNDLLIRNVTIQGTFLDNQGNGGGSGVRKLEVAILHDVPNSSDAVGFFINDEEKTIENFESTADSCEHSETTGYPKLPNRHSNRFRTVWASLICNLHLNLHQVVMHFGWVFRGFHPDTGLPVYANDIAFLSIGNVGQQAIGLLCTDDHSAQTAAVPGCNKTQPVGGPYQTRHGPKFPKRHHWR